MKGKFIFIKLALLLVVAPVAIWFGALSGTARIWRDYRKMGEVSVAVHNRDPRPDLARAVHQDIISDGKLLAGIEKRFRGVSVYSCTPKLEREEAGLSLVNTKIELKGDYKSLLRALRSLEAEENCTLSEISFERKDERESQVTLRLTIHQLIRDE